MLIPVKQESICRRLIVNLSQADHRDEGPPHFRKEDDRDLDVHSAILPSLPAQICLYTLLRRVGCLHPCSNDVHNRPLQDVSARNKGKYLRFPPSVYLCRFPHCSLTPCGQDLQDCMHPDYSTSGTPIRCANDPLTPLYTTFDSSGLLPTSDGLGRVSITPARTITYRPQESEVFVAKTRLNAIHETEAKQDARPARRAIHTKDTDAVNEEDDTMSLFLQARKIAEGNT